MNWATRVEKLKEIEKFVDSLPLATKDLLIGAAHVDCLLQDALEQMVAEAEKAPMVSPALMTWGETRKAIGGDFGENNLYVE